MGTPASCADSGRVCGGSDLRSPGRERVPIRQLGQNRGSRLRASDSRSSNRGAWASVPRSLVGAVKRVDLIRRSRRRAAAFGSSRAPGLVASTRRDDPRRNVSPASEGQRPVPARRPASRPPEDAAHGRGLHQEPARRLSCPHRPSGTSLDRPRAHAEGPPGLPGVNAEACDPVGREERAGDPRAGRDHPRVEASPAAGASVPWVTRIRGASTRGSRGVTPAAAPMEATRRGADADTTSASSASIHTRVLPAPRHPDRSRPTSANRLTDPRTDPPAPLGGRPVSSTPLSTGQDSGRLTPAKAPLHLRPPRSTTDRASSPSCRSRTAPAAPRRPPGPPPRPGAPSPRA